MPRAATVKCRDVSRAARRLLRLPPVPYCVVHRGRRTFTSAASPRIAPPILFVMGGPGAGKGTQCTLLTAEFGGEVAGASDGTVLPADAQRVVAERHPPLPRGGSQRRFGAVHISVGALLRAEMQRHKAGQASHWLPAIKAAIDTGVILPGSITVQLLAHELQRVGQRQHAVNPRIEPAFLIDGFPRSTDNVAHFQADIAPLAHLLHLQCADTTLTQRLGRRAALAAGGSRSDDKEEVVRERLRVFHGETEGVLRWWREECERRRKVGGEGWTYDVDGERSIPEVYEDVRRVYLQFIDRHKDML